MPFILSSNAEALIFCVICKTSWTLTSASMSARCRSLTRASTCFLSRKTALAILSVVFLSAEDSFSSMSTTSSGF